MTEELAYWVAVNRVRGIGAVRFQRLLTHFGQLKAAWSASAAALQAAGIDEHAAQSLIRARSSVDPGRELDRVHRMGAHVLTWDEPGYPKLLREIAQPPPVLYYRGTLHGGDTWALGIVGTRKPTAYGRDVAERLSAELARAGMVIVSGLAKGVDAHAHRGALAGGGRTLAVLGSGLDVVYPLDNLHLAERIVEQGALLTEYALGTEPAADNFPPRNRIISGLSLATIVVEAPAGSGALITAGFAGDQGRDVFAVPGPITSPASAGCHRLIQDGAKLVHEAQDVLNELNLHMVPERREMQMMLPENETEASLLRQFEGQSGQPAHVDELARGCGLPVHEVTSALAMMELKGIVRHLGGMLYVAGR